ncbi:MAG: hypothetical protein AB7P03_27515 [Kofleriaceae bacterium]
MVIDSVLARVLALVVVGGCGTTLDQPGYADEGSPDAAVPQAPARICDGPRVRVVYVVPSDRTPVSEYVVALDNAFTQLRVFVREQLGTGETFCFDGVETIRTPHTASWYMANPSPRGAELTFWDNALDDAFALTGGAFYDPDNIWNYFFDVDEVEGQRLGSSYSVVVHPSSLLRGLTGEFDRTRCQSVGLAGFHLGYSLGAPAPPGCAEGAATCAADSLMWQGYTTFPTTYFVSEQKTFLTTNPFMVASDPLNTVSSCAQ